MLYLFVYTEELSVLLHGVNKNCMLIVSAIYMKYGDMVIGTSSGVCSDRSTFHTPIVKPVGQSFKDNVGLGYHVELYIIIDNNAPMDRRVPDHICCVAHFVILNLLISGSTEYDWLSSREHTDKTIRSIYLLHLFINSVHSVQ